MLCLVLFLFNDTAPTELYTLSLHDALPISRHGSRGLSRPQGHSVSPGARPRWQGPARSGKTKRSVDGAAPRYPRENRSEEHTSELQSLRHLVCRLLLEKKKKQHSRTR